MIIQHMFDFQVFFKLLSKSLVIVCNPHKMKHSIPFEDVYEVLLNYNLISRFAKSLFEKFQHINTKAKFACECYSSFKKKKFAQD